LRCVRSVKDRLAPSLTPLTPFSPRVKCPYLCAADLPVCPFEGRTQSNQGADEEKLSPKLLFRWFLRHPEEVVRTAGSLSVLFATVWKDRWVTISTASISGSGETNLWNNLRTSAACLGGTLSYRTFWNRRCGARSAKDRLACVKKLASRELSPILDDRKRKETPRSKSIRGFCAV
jgi:hypothetical protein